MTRIEAIFGGVLLLFVIGAMSFVFFERTGGVSLGKDTGKEKTRVVAAAAEEEFEPAVFTGDYTEDMCSCFEQGFSWGGKNLSIQSVQYKSGYASCRTALGVDGGNAWTSGWALGEEGKITQRNCRLYLKRVALNK